jgi:hypothetical protein
MRVARVIPSGAVQRASRIALARVRPDLATTEDQKVEAFRWWHLRSPRPNRGSADCSWRNHLQGSVAPFSPAGEFRVVNWCKDARLSCLQACRVGSRAYYRRDVIGFSARLSLSDVESIAENDQLDDLVIVRREVEGKH